MHRDARIDVLRGIAICTVLLLHFRLAYGLQASLLGDVVPTKLLEALAINGNYGVTLFFVVSGFLITSLSMRRWRRLADVDLRRFWVLRASRILPPLVPVLAVIVVLGSLGLPRFANAVDGQPLPPSFFLLAAGSVLTFWHNVLMQHRGYFNYCLNIYWSLSVEEVFYLAMPVLCLTLRRHAALLLACLVCIALGPWYRSQHADSEIFYLYANPACFDAIAFGCLAAFAATRWPLTGKAATTTRCAAAASMVVVYMAGIRGHVVWGFTALAAFTAIWLHAGAGAAAMGARLARISAPLRWLGRHSYELYLVHIVVLGGLLNVVDRKGLGHDERLPWLVLFVGLSCSFALVLARVTRPVEMALRRRFAQNEDFVRSAAYNAET